MNEYQVTAINKPNRMSPHEHITHIGNLANKWRLTREEAIRRILEKREAFYTVDRYTGKKVYIGVVPATFGKGPTSALTPTASGMTIYWPSLSATPLAS